MVNREQRRRGDAREVSKAAADTFRFRFELLPPRLGLDFANTLSNRLTGHPRELLSSYVDLMAWSRHAGILTAGEAERMARQAARHPTEALSAVQHAVALREALYRIFSAVADGRSPQAADLEALNVILSDAFALLRMVATADGFTWGWAGGEETLERVLWPIALSAAELLTSSEVKAVRECAAPNCGWLFLDTTRNRSRRWCDMKVCGNRAKAHRHYERKKQARADDSDDSNRC